MECGESFAAWRIERCAVRVHGADMLRPHAAQGFAALSTLPLGKAGTGQPQLDQIATIHEGSMPETIERVSGQRVVSVTCNIHGISLGDARQKIDAALRNIPAPPKGSTVVLRGQIPALLETISGLVNRNFFGAPSPSIWCKKGSPARRPTRTTSTLVSMVASGSWPLAPGDGVLESFRSSPCYFKLNNNANSFDRSQTTQSALSWHTASFSAA